MLTANHYRANNYKSTHQIFIPNELGEKIDGL